MKKGLGARILNTVSTIIVIGFSVVMMFKVFGPLLGELLEDYANIDWTGLLLWAGVVYSVAVGSYFTLGVCVSRWITFVKGGKKE